MIAHDDGDGTGTTKKRPQLNERAAIGDNETNTAPGLFQKLLWARATSHQIHLFYYSIT
jgi:hypothetical protein